MPAIVVLVKNVPDSFAEKRLEEDFTLDRDTVDTELDEIDQFGIEQALRLRDDHPEENFRVVALSVGPAPAEAALRKALAMGADDAVLLTDDALAGSDVLGTTWAINSAIGTIDDVRLVVTGQASSDGGTGALPGTLSEYLGWPALTNISTVTLKDGTVSGVREDARGTYQLRAALPALVSVGELADPPRFPNFASMMAAKKKEITRLDIAAAGITPDQVGLNSAATSITKVDERGERQPGRMVFGTGGAKEIAAFIAEENLSTTRSAD